ncbi:SNF2 family DNA or RNA helicase [Paenibacillus sp. W4I10]|uniref:SNF2-related protein n=1 Tax=Paenibacillus sp. W4I10 TaxID=3042298 RepID=UPI00278AF067|nr:DEAD/DEAH box helicase [Paenibacillus sp. W4I10]MDQ0724921.1 SNF2 family DNA or RNA helicase [Paenibacillus sp. W4I10]
MIHRKVGVNGTMYGKLELVNGKWKLSEVHPHVVIRMKQLFPRVAMKQADTFLFSNRSNICADLVWFTQRFPMEITSEDRVKLLRGHDKFFEKKAYMEQILTPDYDPILRPGLKPGQKIRHYQLQAIDLCLERRSLLLGDDLGLGKTYTAAGMLLEPDTHPAAVVVQAHLQDQWKEKIESFTELIVHNIERTRPYSLPVADVYLFKYSQLAGWKNFFADGHFQCVIYDEIQELRTGLTSNKGEAAKILSDAAEFRLGLSATPIYNYGTEIWNVLQFLDPDLLGTYSEFMREWCSNDRKVHDPVVLGSFLREHNVMLRRTKREVGQQLPPVNQIVEVVEPDLSKLKSVKAQAKQLALKASQGTYLERGPAARELDLLMRQATGVAKAAGVAQYAKQLLEAGIPLLLVGWHRDVYEIWLKELADYRPAMYTGSESDMQKIESVRRFVQGETNVFILSLRSGAGLDGLQYRCSTILFGELDWSPKVHEQIIGRLNREGQEEKITVVYLNAEEGSDRVMLDVLGVKHAQSEEIIDPHDLTNTKPIQKLNRTQALVNQVL